jgi:hypothetical protein
LIGLDRRAVRARPVRRLHVGWAELQRVAARSLPAYLVSTRDRPRASSSNREISGFDSERAAEKSCSRAESPTTRSATVRSSASATRLSAVRLGTTSPRVSWLADHRSCPFGDRGTATSLLFSWVSRRMVPAGRNRVWSINRCRSFASGNVTKSNRSRPQYDANFWRVPSVGTARPASMSDK